MKKAQSLYEQIGDNNLKKILESFYNEAFESEIIGKLFTKTEAEIIKDKQFCFLTQFLGGPPRYNEKYGTPKMRQRHLPHKIDNRAKEEWLKLMKEAINSSSLSNDLKIALFNCFPQVAQHMVNS